MIRTTFSPRHTWSCIPGRHLIRIASNRGRSSTSPSAPICRSITCRCLQADLLNATNKKGLYNIESVFGGTHPPRMLAMRVRYTY